MITVNGPTMPTSLGMLRIFMPALSLEVKAAGREKRKEQMLKALVEQSVQRGILAEDMWMGSQKQRRARGVTPPWQLGG